MIKGELVVKSFCMVIFAELGARLRPDAHNHAGTGSSFQFELFLIKNATVGFVCTESTILDLLATLLRQSGGIEATAKRYEIQGSTHGSGVTSKKLISRTLRILHYLGQMVNLIPRIFPAFKIPHSPPTPRTTTDPG